MSMETLPNMMRISDVQKHLKIDKNRAYSLVKMKGFPSIKIGKTYFIPQDAYEKWIKDNIGREVFL